LYKLAIHLIHHLKEVISMSLMIKN